MLGVRHDQAFPPMVLFDSLESPVRLSQQILPATLSRTLSSRSHKWDPIPGLVVLGQFPFHTCGVARGGPGPTALPALCVLKPCVVGHGAFALQSAFMCLAAIPSDTTQGSGTRNSLSLILEAGSKVPVSAGWSPLCWTGCSSHHPAFGLCRQSVASPGL